MLLIDGIKYNLRIPKTEEELEGIVKEHAKDIFGNDSLYLDLKQKIKSPAGIGSIPDGYVITFGDKPCWHIVEVELASHPLYEHIVSQISRFTSGIANLQSQKAIIDAIYEEIGKDEVLKGWIKSKISSEEIHRFLANLISNSPIITIIIDEKTKELEEVCHSLPGEKKIVEFKTFEREGVGLVVHAHLFEPLARFPPARPLPTLPSQPAPTMTPTPSSQSTPPLTPTPSKVEITVQSNTWIKYPLFYVKRVRRFFPGYEIPFILETDIGEIETYVTSAPKGTQRGDPDAGIYTRKNMAKWYSQHPEIKVGDKFIIEAIEPMKRYRLKKM